MRTLTLRSLWMLISMTGLTSMVSTDIFAEQTARNNNACEALMDERVLALKDLGKQLVPIYGPQIQTVLDRLPLEKDIAAYLLPVGPKEQPLEVYTHVHVVEEIIAVTQGSLSMEVGGEILELARGDVVAIPPWTPHRVLGSGHDAYVEIFHAFGNQQGRFPIYLDKDNQDLIAKLGEDAPQYTQTRNVQPEIPPHDDGSGTVLIGDYGLRRRAGGNSIAVEFSRVIIPPGASYFAKATTADQNLAVMSGQGRLVLNGLPLSVRNGARFKAVRGMEYHLVNDSPEVLELALFE